MKSVFIVGFSYGSYDDYTTGVVCAAESEDLAKELVKGLTALAEYKNKISAIVQRFYNAYVAEHKVPILSFKILDDAKLCEDFKILSKKYFRERKEAVEEFEKQQIAKSPMPEELEEVMSIVKECDCFIDWNTAEFTYYDIDVVR